DDLKSIERVADDRLAVLSAYVAIGKRQLEIFKHCLIVEQVIALKHKTDVAIAQLAALLRVQGMDRHVVEIVFTIPRVIVHADDMKEGGVGAAGGAQVGR